MGVVDGDGGGGGGGVAAVAAAAVVVGEVVYAGGGKAAVESESSDTLLMIDIYSTSDKSDSEEIESRMSMASKQGLALMTKAQDEERLRPVQLETTR